MATKRKKAMRQDMLKIPKIAPAGMWFVISADGNHIMLHKHTFKRRCPLVSVREVKRKGAKRGR